MKKLNVLAVCGNGLGSSLALMMILGDVLKAHGIEANLSNSDISGALSNNPDIIVTGSNFESQFKNYSVDYDKTTIIYLRNIVSKVEMEEKVVPVIKSQMSL